MATTAQLNQADIALQRAKDALDEARTGVLRAQRRLTLALDAGSGVDPAILAQAQQNLIVAQNDLRTADAVFTTAQQNYTAVFNATDTDAVEDPQVNNSPPVVPPPPPLTTTASPQGNPPDPTLALGDNEQAINLSDINSGNTTVDAPAQPVDTIPLASLNTGPNNNLVFDPNTGELLPAGSAQAEQVLEQEVASERVQNAAPIDLGGNFTEVYDVETGKFNVVNLDTGAVVDEGLSEQEAILRAQERSVGDPGYGLDAEPAGGDYNVPSQASIRAADFTARSVNAQAMLESARQQSILSAQRKAAGAAVGDGDWRVRLRLAPNANYLYKAPGGTGILEPLRNTDGVIFPYTPRIDTQYSAEYAPYDLTHNNYRGYFYKGSRVGEVVLTADFTAQDTSEANYLLAVIHFFKSCTKMFYGQDTERGSPPPLVYLSGLGEYQFNEHACVISNFNYSLPPDVDYIRARSTLASSAGVTQGGTGLMWQRSLADSATASYSLSSILSRLTGANIPKGAVNYPPAPPNLGQNSPTYVPTKMQMSLTLLPIQSRQQVSQQFSLKAYANGNLLKGGFW